MWQRVQTLYLAIASILVGSMFFCKMATIIGPEGDNEIIRYYENWPFLILLISLFSANVISLLTFKARILQMRVSIIAALMLIGFQIWLGVYFFIHKNEMVFSFTAVFPIVAAILDVLAARAIMMDEAMVQSASRLRKSRKNRRK